MPPRLRLAVLVLPLLAACGRSNKSPDQSIPATATSAAAAAGSVTITVEAPPLAGADRLLKAEEPHIRACYDASPRTPAASGAVAFSIALDETGVVSSVGVTRTGTLPLPVGSCVRAALVDVTFDPPAGGATTINGRFVFAPGTGSQ